MNIKEILIDDIGLSNRSKNALHRVGTQTVEELLQWTEESLSDLRNLGTKSIAEILEKIKEYKMYMDSEEKDFDTWLTTEEGQDYAAEYFQSKDVRIDVLELLSARTYNVLLMNGYTHVHQVLTRTLEQLMELPQMDRICAEEAERMVAHFVEEQKENIIAAYRESHFPVVVAGCSGESISEWIRLSENCESVLQYVQQNDRTIEQMAFATRGRNRLISCGYKYLSEILFLTKEELFQMPSMGGGSVTDIVNKISAYLDEHEEGIRAFCSGDTSVLWSDDVIQKAILDLYETTPFRGYSFQEYQDALSLPDFITEERLKANIGCLLAAGKLEYVDFRCYRIYGKFEEFLHTCAGISDRSRDFIKRKLDGQTLDAIGQDYEITRERVRQVIKKDTAKIRAIYEADTGMKWFDEDYYQYVYENYEFDRTIGRQWLGAPEAVWRYLELIDAAKGTKDLKEALEDRKIDAGLRLKIKNYLNRNKIYLDGMWVEKRRADIEDYVLQKLCKEDVTYDEFCKIYNQLLQEQDIEYDANIYYTEDVYYTRKNRLVESKKVLWKFGEKLRYYDIESQDYTELLDVLNLDAYENVEISTLKFIENYPDVMDKYDICDQYELHNLLKKIIPDGSFHDMKFVRMPDIRFGNFDRETALVKLMKNNAPIDAEALVELIHQEYGYDKKTIYGTYLPLLIGYYHEGMYGTELKEMPAEHINLLKEQLQEDFYYIDDIRKLYVELIPTGDVETVNPYNLKRMGFQVLSTYVIQNHKNVESFFERLLTKEYMADISNYKKRFTYIPNFYRILMNLKKSLEIIEFEPNQVIHMRKLEQVGVTKDAIAEFCEQVYCFVEEDTYFTAKSLRNAGFVSELYDLGFSDWFYGNLLISDERFSSWMMFNNLVLYKGKKRIMIRDFLEDRIKHHGTVDALDLITELEEIYGCKVDEKWDLVYKLEDSEVYYDKYLDRFYANEELFYQELDMLDG